MQHTGNLQQTVRNIYLELNVLLCLNHPNIVRFYGMVGRFPPSGSSEPLELGMVFEFCEDGNLHTLLFRQKRMLTFPERIAIARDVASAMVHVHGLNIIHRDIIQLQHTLNKEPSGGPRSLHTFLHLLFWECNSTGFSEKAGFLRRG